MYYPTENSSRALPPKQVYFTDEVAALLNLTVLQFRRHRLRLQKAGMPGPILSGKAMRFPKAAMDEWLRDPNRKIPAEVGPTLSEIQADRVKLHQAYVASPKKNSPRK